MGEVRGLVPEYDITEERRNEIVRLLFPTRNERWERGDPVEGVPLFDKEEVGKAIDALKKGKAPGPDGVTAEMLKLAWERAEECILQVLNGQLREQKFPKDWKEARLVLIPKGGKDRNCPSAHRPISIINSTAKLYETLIRDRLAKEVEDRNILADTQYGFRKGRSTLDALSAVTEWRRNVREKWAIFIAVDVKNAFNTASWAKIMKSLVDADVPAYIRNVISEYLNERAILMRGNRFPVSSGVPQGSVLGPLLWNLMYNGILSLPLPEGVRLVGYADDIGILVSANDVDTLNWRTKITLEMVDEWLMENLLELAPEKTAAVIMKGPRKREEVRVEIRDTLVEVTKAVKYLGIWLDSQGTFGHHVLETAKKADRRTTALTKLLPNISGPSTTKRRILMGVVHSTILYGASIWRSVCRIERYRQILESTQRKILLRVARAYKTVSARAAQVVTGTIPIELLIEERAEWEKAANHTKAAWASLRTRTIERWQAIWEENTTKAQRVKMLIPNIRRWLECPHRRDMDYALCQFMTGHGSFRTYTRRIGKAPNENCAYCGDLDTPDHTILLCPRWREERRPIHRLTGGGGAGLIEAMLTDREIWTKVASTITEIILRKEREERAMQQQAARQQDE